MYIDYNSEKEYLYNIKKPDGKTLHTDIKIIGMPYYEMRDNFSPIIMICGRQRSGKSFIANWLAWRYKQLFNHKEDFKLIDRTFYNPKEAMKMIKKINHQPVIIDEAGAIFYKTEWYAQFAILFNKIIQTQGYKANAYIFVSPFGNEVVKSLRKHIDYLILVRRRGIIKVKKLPKKYDNMNDEIPKPFLLQNNKVPKNAIPEKDWKEYEKFSIEKKKEMEEKYGVDVEAADIQNKDPFGRRL